MRHGQGDQVQLGALPLDRQDAVAFLHAILLQPRRDLQDLEPRFLVGKFVAVDGQGAFRPTFGSLRQKRGQMGICTARGDKSLAKGYGSGEAVHFINIVNITRFRKLSFCAYMPAAARLPSFKTRKILGHLGIRTNSY
jgi:hypothetical protein